MEGENNFNCVICKDVMIRDDNKFMCKNCNVEYMVDLYDFIKCINCEDGIMEHHEEGWTCETCYTITNFCRECNIQTNLVNWHVRDDEKIEGLFCEFHPTGNVNKPYKPKYCDIYKHFYVDETTLFCWKCPYCNDIVITNCD